jgi:hypothetical protein
MPLEAGRYRQMRLVLAANDGANPLANAAVPTGGSEVALKTPSGQQSGVKMKVDIDVQPGQVADVVIDMDGCRSVVVVNAGNSGQRLLKPVVRVVPRLLSGVLGHVEPALAGGTTRVSLQQGGETVRATVPDTTGRFLLQPVEAGIYDLVITAAGRATTVLTGVPVMGDTVTPVNASSEAFVPPASDMATAEGKVSGSADAAVAVRQALSAGTVVEVAGGPVDEQGDYAHAVPVAAPRVAAYGSGAPSFSADTGAAGRYTVRASSGATVLDGDEEAYAAGASVTTDFTFP